MTTDTLDTLKEVGESGEWESLLDQPCGAEIMPRSLYEPQEERIERE